jgi:Fe-S cluster assembly protein SufD
VDDPDAVRLVFVNGHFVPDLSDGASAVAGLSVTALSTALHDGLDLDLAGSSSTEAGRSLSALNDALVGDGCLIELSGEATLQGPLQLLMIDVGQDTPAMAHPRNIIRLGDGARLHLIETHLALEGGLGLVNLIDRITIGAGASLRHDRLQRGESTGRLITHTTYGLSADSRLTQTVATFGGSLVRNEIEPTIEAGGAEVALSGLYLTRHRQHVDTAIRVDHRAGNGLSDQYYKGVLDDRSHAIFAGRIIVHRGAQKTNAYQSNGNLLLSPDAEIDTKPELEIFADDVKCSHGATAGELDERELFYLRSRGLDVATARCMLTYAFASDVLERFTSTAVRTQAQRALRAWLPGGEVLGGLT